MEDMRQHMVRRDTLSSQPLASKDPLAALRARKKASASSGLAAEKGNNKNL